MSKIVRYAFLVAAVAALQWSAAAQHGGVAAAGGLAPAAAPAAPPAGRVSHSATSGSSSLHPHRGAPVGVHGTGTARHSTTPTETTAATTSTAASQNVTPNVVVVPADSGITLQDLTGQVPGLGFDYEHLAAISGNLAEKALIDPVTMEELALAERFNRGGVGGSAYLLGGYGYGYAGGDAPADNGDPNNVPQDAQAQPTAPAPQPAPQIIILQQPAPGVSSSGEGSAEERHAAAAPLPEASDFLLVLKSGVMVSAVAFTRQGDDLIYVTKEGNRRTMSVATIDSDATSKINAARGTPLKLSI
jgi:hypothetical protein